MIFLQKYSKIEDQQTRLQIQTKVVGLLVSLSSLSFQYIMRVSTNLLSPLELFLVSVCVLLLYQ